MSEPIQRFIDSGEAEALDPQQLLTWALKTFGQKIALSCSFGAPEGLVLLDMMHRIDPNSRVFVLDTGRLPQATYDLIDRVRESYDKKVEVIFPEASAVEAMVRSKGMIFPISEIIAFVSRLMTLEPGDVLLTGTPAGVGASRTPPRWLRDGDVVEVEIERVGRLRNYVRGSGT